MLILTILKWIGIIILIILGLILLTLCYALFATQSYAAICDFDCRHYYFCLYDPLRLYFVNLKRRDDKNSLSIALLFGLIKIGTNTKKEKPGKTEKKEKHKKIDKNKSKKSRKGKSKKQKIIEVVKADYFKPTVKHILSELIGFFKKLLPKKFKANIGFSTAKPDITGYITAAISVIPFLNGNKSRIHPDFTADVPYINGKISIKGGIKLVQILTLFIRLYSDKGFRRILQNLR